MNKCPKCRCVNINGPRYKKTRWGGESLEYTCGRCGYSQDEQTHDDRAKDTVQPMKKDSS